MAWFKVDDRFAEHPKVLHARALGGFGPLGLWLAAGTWSNTHLTDGFIPEPWVQINQGTEFAEFLVDAGLWLRVEGGWEFKDFTEYQPSKAEVEAKRSETSAARSAAGKASATKRQQTMNKRGTNDEQTVNPVPVPVPVTTKSEGACVRVSGKVVNETAWALTEQIVAEFTSQTGLKLRVLTSSGDPSEAAKRVYGRVVKYSDISFEEHRDIIARTLASKWWGSNQPTIGVVYGPKVFEENITRPAESLSKPTDLKTERDRKRLAAMARLMEGGDAA